jgi:GTP-binding protein Era
LISNEKQNFSESQTPKTKAGYVAIIGKPNAGKSTLMNAIVGAKLSIVTAKPQTTRKRVLGILTENDVQIIFLDTPGILNPKYKMQTVMMDYVDNSIAEADCVMFIYDATRFNSHRPFSNELLDILKNINKNTSPKTKKNIILLLNKFDLLKDRKEVLPMIDLLNKMDLFSDIIPISALKESNIDEIVSTISKYLSYSDFYYDPELLSTQPERFFVSEIIRENIFKSYSDEIPYSCEVNIVDFKEREFDKWFISAEIIVEKQTQKIIIIGSKGEKLKKVMEHSRHQIEEHLQVPTYIEVFVKVREKWRDNANFLRSFGY